MHPSTQREVNALFRAQEGVVSRRQLRALGVNPSEVGHRVSTGVWEPAGGRVLRVLSSRPGPAQDLWVAVLSAGPGGIVSHRSAAWLWDLGPAPARPSMTVARAGAHDGAQAEWHRPRQLPSRVVVRRGFPCTDVARMLVDLATELAPDELDDLVDRSLALRLVTLDQIAAEITGLQAGGRRGPAVLRAALQRRGFAGSVAPSVLESRFLRLLASAGINPLATEVRVGPHGRYRLDTQLAPRVFAEVDGFAYHASPEAKADDERRRNRLRLEGWTLLVYTWRDVVDDGVRVVTEIRRALVGAAGRDRPAAGEPRRR